MSKYYESVEQINAEIEKNNDLCDKIFKGYLVICAFYIIPCIIQLFVSIDTFAFIDIISVGIVFLSGYFSCRFKNNKWCIATGFCMMYSIAFGVENVTFIETLIYRLFGKNFEINALMFIPIMLLMIFTIYCNQKDKELRIQQRCYAERYREKELLTQRIESGEKMLRNIHEQYKKQYGSNMIPLDAPISSTGSEKKNYMDEI